MENVLFIYADRCRDCKKMEKFILKAIDELKLNVDVDYINSEDEKAIDVAIEKGIEDIPACVIGENVFFGKRGFSYELISDALKKMIIP